MKIRRLSLRTATLGVASLLAVMQASTVSAVSLHNGLISYWRLNEGAGAVANDTGAAGGVADAGTLRNAPAWITGKFNAGLQFDGTSQDVLIPNSTDMDVATSGVTLSAWVKLDQLPSEITGGFSGIYDSTPDNYAMYLDKANNELRFKATNSNGASTTSAQHPGIKASSLNTTDWFHVMGVYDGDKGQSRIYLNGQLIDLSAQTSNAFGLKGTIRAGQTASIGAQPAAADPFASTNFFKGGISDVAVWNRSLGLAEAQYLYNGGTGNAVGAANPNINPIPTTINPVLPAAQPVVYYKFNGNLSNSGTGGSSLDAVVNGTLPTAYATTGFGSGLDLTSNPTATDSKLGTGNFLSVNYKLADNGTIATQFTASQLFNFATLWSNSSQGNDWESWVYGDGRIAARANRDTPILGQSLWDLADPAGSNHIAFTWTRTSATEMVVKMYVNGEFVDERVGVWRDTGDTFFIGGGIAADTLSSNHYGNGTFDEFRIYSSALSNAEILYLSQNAPEVVMPTFAADFNSDGLVNGADLGAWKTGFGKATGAVRADGDADADGDVDGADFLTWQKQFGSGSATVAAGAVPEPAAVVLVGLGIVGGLMVRRGRSSR